MQANWRAIGARLAAGAAAGAVVKADAYGLGALPVGQALANAGCRRFFVATPDEGIALRAALPRVEIYVLDGLIRGAAGDYAEHRLTPCLLDPGQVEAWVAAGRRALRALPAALHVDSGMGRAGMPPRAALRYADDPGLLNGVSLAFMMSHLACADDPGHPLNATQRDAFATLRAAFPRLPASLGASAAVLLGAPYHFDLLRPGIALYGGATDPSLAPAFAAIGIKPVLRWEARILQILSIPEGGTVGYGASWTAARDSRIALVAAGYADGYLRALSGRAVAAIGDQVAPLAGRVSMDLLSFDVTDLDPSSVAPDVPMALLNDDFAIDDMARAAGTIAYEVLTRLSPRMRRRYVGGGVRRSEPGDGQPVEEDVRAS